MFSLAKPTTPLLLLPLLTTALNNTFGLTPLLGYNTYNDVACSPNQTHLRTTIHALSTQTLIAAGYKYFQLDCGWQGFTRSPNGSLTFDEKVFPDGIAPLSALARGLGLVWSMYTNQGVYSCDTRGKEEGLRPGSLGFEREDARVFEGWGTGYVKVWFFFFLFFLRDGYELILTSSTGR